MPVGICPNCRKLYLWEARCRQQGRCPECRKRLEVVLREELLARVRALRHEQAA